MEVERLGPRWMEIDLGRLRGNLATLRRKSGPVEMIPVVKADAYGHGAVEIVRALEKDGVGMVAVATLGEALRLREAFVRCRILVLAAVPRAQIPEILVHQITPTVCDADFAAALSGRSAAEGRTTAVHFYVDTGMGRMGYAPGEAREHLEKTLKMPALRVEYLYSHFSAADQCDADSDAYTENQWRQMENFCAGLSRKLPVHMSNSAASWRFPEYVADAVRPGLLCYGVPPNPELKIPDLQPVMSLKCRPLFSKRMRAGDRVGYGATKQLTRDSYVMTLPAGYADGIALRLSPHLRVGVRGKTYPLVGRVCMDMLMVETGEDRIDPGEVVVLLGEGAQGLWEWSAAAATIPYEILTGMGRRWDRLYVNAGQRVALERAD